MSLSRRRSTRNLSAQCSALLGATRALLILGRVAEARDGAEELCELLPADPEALRLLGQALARAGQFDRAVEILERARELASDDVEIATELGLAYLEVADLAGAEAELRRALERDDLGLPPARRWGESWRSQDVRRRRRRSIGRRSLLPSFGEVAYALAELERRRGRLDAATRSRSTS